MKYSILFAIGLSLVLPLQADAREGKHKKSGKATPEEVFRKKDKDNDGVITKEEFASKKKDPSKVAKRFAKRDKNSDGKLSLEEFSAKKTKGEKAKPADKKANKKTGENAGKKGGKKGGRKHK